MIQLDTEWKNRELAVRPVGSEGCSAGAFNCTLKTARDSNVDPVIHFQRRFFRLRPTDKDSRNSGECAVRRNVRQNDTARADLGPFTNFDIAKDLGAGADENVLANLRMAIAAFLTGSAKRHFVQHGNVVLHDRSLTNDHRGSVIDQNPPADARRRVNVDPKRFGNPVLQMQSQQVLILLPQPVSHSIAGETMHALEIQQWNQAAIDCRVTFADCENIGLHGATDPRVRRKSFVDDLPQLHGGQGGATELARQMVTDGILESFVIQDRGVQKTGKDGLLRNVTFRRFTYRSPDADVWCMVEFCVCGHLI